MIRAAKFTDTTRIVQIMREAHERSIYADMADFDDIEAKQLCARMLQRHGHQNYGGTQFLVSEKDGEVYGFIIALIDQVYPCLNKFSVTDLAFIFAEGADPLDAVRMIRHVLRWAQANPKVIEVYLGVNDSLGPWERVGQLYEREGLRQCGGMYRRTIYHEEAANVQSG